MTGPEHYAEAERLLALAVVPSGVVTMPDRSSMEDVDRVKKVMQERGLGDVVVASESIRIDITPILLAAQVHATLAQTAATVEAGGLTEAGDSGFAIPRYPSWAKAVRP